MKLKNYYIGFVLLFIGFVGFAQTPDHLLRGSNSSKDIQSKPLHVKDKKVNIVDQTSEKSSSPESANRSSSSSQAGTTPAEFSVSLSGAATYNIPIATPPGIKNINPNIGLSFSSQASNGLAGWGWNVSGLSSISRVSSNIFHDDFVDGVDFDSYDRFSLDGQRLILKSGIYGANGSEYQTEKYSHVKVRAYGTSPYGANYGPSYFIVYYPDGSRAWYGNAGNSRGKLEWAIYKKQDPQGNFVQYSYLTTNNLKTIDKVAFGSRTGTSAPIEIKFYYKNRKRPELAYINGTTFKRSNILDRIEVKGNGQLFRKYVLTHNETQFGYEQLISVREYNKNNQSLNPITFNYDNSSTNLHPDTFSGTIYPGYNYQTDAILSGEFNGDGDMDFILYNKNTKNKIHVFDNAFESSYNNTDIARTYNVPHFDAVISNNMLNHQGKLLSQQGITFIKENINGSIANVDFKSYYHGAVSLYYHYTKTWNAPTYNYQNTPTSSTRKKMPKEFVSGDFNGDGLTDVLAIGKPYTNRYCYEYECPGGGDGDPWDPQPIIQQPDESIEDFELRKQKNVKPQSGNRLPPDEIIDIDDGNGGSGTCYSCSTYTVSNRSVYFIDLDRNLTSGYVNYAGSIQKNFDNDDQVLAGDFNGDGKSDLFHFSEGKLYVYELNSNNQLVLIHTETDSYIKMNRPIVLGDYNGDGKMDFVVPTANNNKNWRFFLSKGNSIYKYTKLLDLFTYTESAVTYHDYTQGPILQSLGESRFLSQDVNGDGKSDLIKQVIFTAYTSSGQLYSDDYVNIHVNHFDETDATPRFVHTSNFVEANSGVSRYGVPIFLNVDQANDNIEYAYITANHLSAYKFEGNHRRDVTLEQITNNGITHQIDYYNLTNQGNDYEQIYTGGYDEIYPYVNLNVAPSFKLVDEVRQIGSGITRRQNYRYTGAVSNAYGLGFTGFKQIQKTNWNGYGVGTVWDITDYDPEKRGAVVQNWTSLSPSTTPYSFIEKTNYTYQTTLTADKVFINVPIQISSINDLTGITQNKSLSYDSFYNPTNITTSFPGGSETVTYQYHNNVTANSQWYAVGRLTNKVVNNVLGSDTFNTENKYFYNNNLLTEVRKKGNGTPWIYEYYQYDGWGNVTQKKLTGSGVADRIENFEFDSTGRFMLKSIDLEGMETTYTYETSTGNPTSTTSPYGHTTQYQYDGWQRVSRETNYLGKHTYFTYSNSSLSGLGGLLKHTNYNQGQDEKVYYNAFGWVVRESVLTLSNKWKNKDIEYDIAGKKLKESEPYFSTSSASQWNQYAYDQYGRPISKQLYTGRIITTEYDGLSVTVDDGVKTVGTTRDALGNVVSLVDPGGIVNYTYYANGTLKSTEYDGYTTSVSIDGWGRKTALNDPSAGNYTYEYNILGEVTKEVTPKGETNYSYDNYGRLTSKYITGDETNLDLQYTYNGASKLLTNIAGTDLINNKSYNYNYHYDSYYRPIKIEEYTDSNVFKRIATYDTYGRVNSEIYDSQNLGTGVSNLVKVKNIFDGAGILKEIRDFNSNDLLWRLNTENARGQSLSVTLGNGLTKRRTYNNYGYLTNITDEKLQIVPIGTPPPDPIVALKMDYDFDSQRGVLNSRKNYAFTNWDESFGYDNLDRLTSVNGAVDHDQFYDDKGRITNNSFVGDYNYANAAIYQLADIELNNQGDLYYQQNKLQQVTYNAFKKPVKIYQEDNGRVDFEYGPLMNRTHAYYGGIQEDKTLRQYQKHYSSIIPVEIVEDNTVGSTKIITYVGGDAYTAPIAHIKKEVIGPGAVDGYHYLHRDYLGSILAISDEDTNIVEERQFGAWGLVDNFKSFNQGDDFGHDSLLGRGFTGHEHFFEVALIHMNGRMYDAKLGRFLSPDNFVQDPYSTQSFNRYGYAWNNPLMFNDPSGEIIPLVILAGVVVGAYFGGVQANGGEWAPWKWNWNSVDTWVGVIGGGIIGGFSAGVGAAVAGSVSAALSTVGITGGILGGAITGIAGGLVGGAISGFFMAGMPGGNGDYLGGAIKGALTGAALGGFLGGTIGGLTTPKGHSIWTGAKLRPTPVTVSEVQPQPIQAADDALSLEPNTTKPTIKPENTNVTKPVKINKLEQSYVKTRGVDGNVKYELVDELVKVRHHTSPQALKQIEASKLINPSRGQPYGVDVEVAPFVAPKNANFGQAGQGAFIEFMVPRSQLTMNPFIGGGSGNAARIITNAAPLDISSSSWLNFVKWKWF